jgi:hypothetical protein
MDFTEILKKIRFSNTDAERTITPKQMGALLDKVLESGIDELEKYFGGDVKTKTYVLEVLRDRIKAGDSRRQLAQLGFMFLFYFEHEDVMMETTMMDQAEKN